MSEWKMVKLGEVADIKGGYAFKSDSFVENETPIIRIGSLNGDTVDLDYKICYPTDFYNQNPIFRIDKNDILIAMSGATVGKIGKYTLDIPALLNQRVGKIRPYNNVIDNQFLFRFMQSENVLLKIQELSFGCAQPNISSKQIEQIEIFLPPLEIQQKIATVLDKANNLIELRKTQIEKLDMLVKSKFIDMFGDPATNPMGWEVKPFSTIILSVTNGASRRRKTEENMGDIVLRLREIRSNNIDYSHLNRIALTSSEKRRFLVHVGDLLFIRVNGNPDYVGRCAVFTQYPEAVYYNDHIMRVAFDCSKVEPNFIAFLLNMDYGRYKIKNQIKTSAGQYTINQLGLGNIVSYLPPISLQTQFANFAEQVEQQKNVLNQSLKKLETNYKALMQGCFNGELFQ